MKFSSFFIARFIYTNQNISNYKFNFEKCVVLIFISFINRHFGWSNWQFLSLVYLHSPYSSIEKGALKKNRCGLPNYTTWSTYWIFRTLWRYEWLGSTTVPHSAFTSNRAHHHRRVIRLNICVYKYIYIYKSLRPAQHITELCVKCLFLLMLLSTMWRGIIVRSCLRIRCFQEIPLTSLSGGGGCWGLG